MPDYVDESQKWVSEEFPDYKHTDTDLEGEALPYPLVYRRPKWSKGSDPKIGILEAAFAPSFFASLPLRDQVFITDDGQLVNINCIEIKWEEFLEPDYEQPKCANCNSVEEAINSWRKPRHEKEWMCNRCGEYT